MIINRLKLYLNQQNKVNLECNLCCKIDPEGFNFELLKFHHEKALNVYMFDNWNLC